MVNLLKQRPQNYLLKKYFDGQENPGNNLFEYITVENTITQTNQDSTNVFHGDVQILGNLFVDLQIESEINKIQSRYLTIYEPNEIEQIEDKSSDDLFYNVSDEVPTGDVGTQNQTFTLQNTDVQPESVSIRVDGQSPQITDTDDGDGTGTLSDGGSITYQTGEIILTQQPQTSITQSYTYMDNWQVGGSNVNFLLTKTPIKPYSVFVNVDKGETSELLITDDGEGNLSDGGTINYNTGQIILDQSSQPTFTLSVRYVYYVDYHTEDTEGLFNNVPTQGLIINRGSTNQWDKKILWDEKPQNTVNYFSFVQNDETTLEYVYFKFDQNSPLYPQFDDLFLSSVYDDTFGGNLTINQDLTVLGNTNLGGDATIDGNLYFNWWDDEYQFEIVDGNATFKNNLTVEETLYQNVVEMEEVTINESIDIGNELNVQNLHVTESTIMDGPVTINKLQEEDLFNINHNLQHFFHDVQIDGDLFLGSGTSLQDVLSDSFVLKSGDTVNGQLNLNKQGDSYQLVVNDEQRFNITQEFYKGTSSYQIDVKNESIFRDNISVTGQLVEQDQGFIQGDLSDSILYNLTLNNNLEVSGTIITHDDILPDSNLLHNIGSDTLRIDTVYQNIFDGNITNQIFQDVQENVYQSQELEYGDICELKDGKLVKQTNPEQKKLFVISENPQVHLQTNRENSYPIQLQGSVQVKLTNDSINNIIIGDEIVLDNNGIGKIKTEDDNNKYILGQTIEIKDNKIVILLY